MSSRLPAATTEAAAQGLKISTIALLWKPMIFKLKSIKGRSRKSYKEWLDETKRYRITWITEVGGVRVPPHFYACVRIRLPNGREMWDFAGRRGPYRTFKLASKACETHAKENK
ncbi:MAG: hypothetical protein ABSG67_01375 [Thermoguttaceae bacterium]